MKRSRIRTTLTVLSLLSAVLTLVATGGESSVYASTSIPGYQTDARLWHHRLQFRAVPNAAGLMGGTITSAVSIELPGVGIRRAPFGDIEVTFNLALITLLLGAYPLLYFVVAPIRGARRIRNGQCPRCGYVLVGNESGVCTECGRLLSAVIASPTRRALVCLILAGCAAIVAESVIETFGLRYRIALLSIQSTGSETGATILMALLRTVIVGGSCLWVSTALDPHTLPFTPPKRD